MQFYHTQIKQVFAKKIPTFIVRYEDLIINPEKTLSEVFAFLFGITTKELKGTVLEKRIKGVSDLSFREKKIYPLKDERMIDKNHDMYPQSLQEDVKLLMKEYNIFYGYTTLGKPKNDLTSFFKYDEGSLTTA